MFTQPSVNQIASTYQGNPAPLARKVDQDKKQNNGIPQDLRQLLALNDITQGRNAMGIQQALQIPTNMPTVAQDLQERARQALQARQMQQAQEMQRKNGMPNMVPPGTPRPPMQAQGLDMLESNVGEEYAHGGIIGFDGKTGSKVEDSNKEYSDESLGMGYLPERPKPLSALAKLISNAIARPKKPSMMLDESEAPNITPTKEPETPAEVSPTSVKVLAPPAPSKANVNAQIQNRVNAPETPGIAAALPAEQSAAYKKLSEMMNLDANAQERLAQEKFKQQVGNRDLSIYDRTASELEARKQKLNAPKAGYDAMMEYLEQIAMGGGRTAAESGSMGASRQRALQKERLSQQDTLMDKILELGAKKSDAEYAQKEKMYQVGQERYKEVYKNAFDAAKSVNSSDDEAKRIAAQAVENEKNRQNQIRTAQIGAQDRDNLMSRAKALMAANPKLGLEEAMKRAAMAAGATQMEASGVRDTKAYTDAKEKLDARFQHLISDTPYGKKQKELYDTALADLKATHGMAGGINTLPKAQAASLPSKDQLVVGQIYQTARGPAKWNGTSFEQ